MRKKNIIKNFSKIEKLNTILNKFIDIYTIILYGSRLSSFYTNLSDIDLFYLSSKVLTLIEEAEVLYRINSFLNTTNVDFTNLQKLSLKEQYDMLTKGKIVYCSNEEKLSDYKEQIILKYFDFKPFYEEYFLCFKQNLKSGDLLKT